MRRLTSLVLASMVAIGLGAAPALASTDACWGQETSAFAQMGEMGVHASQQVTPRAGLANPAKDLYGMGVLDAPTLQSLGAYLVIIGPDLTVGACMP
jgi:hypothetical protein